MMKLIKKWDLSIVYKICLVLLDIAFINISSFLALWVRFNMHISEIPIEYYTSVWDVAIANTIVTVVISPRSFGSIRACGGSRALRSWSTS